MLGFKFSNNLLRYPLSLRDWIGVLAISSKYVIAGGVEEAFDVLKIPQNSSRLNPVYKLRLAWEYSLEKWYDECINDVLQYMDLSPEDIRDLEPKLTSLVLCIRDRCQRHRHELVPYLPNTIHHPTCTNNAACITNWQVAFSSAMMFYIHTSKRYTGRDVFTKLQKVDIPDFHPECRRLTMAELESNGILWKEEEFLQKGASAFKSTLISTRPSFPRPEPRFIVNPEVEIGF